MTKPSLGKKLILAGLGVGLALTALAKPAEAQEINLFNSTAVVNEQVETQNTATIQLGKFTLGMDSYLGEGSKPGTTVGAKATFGNSTFAIHTRKDADGTSLEGRMLQQVGDVTIAAGIGSNKHTHIGARYGLLKDFGFGASYVTSEVDGERQGDVRAEIWRVWKGGIFTGMRESGDELLTIISKPSDDGFAVRYGSVIDLKGEDQWHSVVVGAKSRPGYYGLNHGDSQFWLSDDSVFGENASNIGDSPFRYLVPPTAWLIDGVGGTVEFSTDGDSNTLMGQAIAYVKGDWWVGPKYTHESSSKDKVGFDFGKTGEKLKLSAQVAYDLETEAFQGGLSVLAKIGK